MENNSLILETSPNNNFSLQPKRGSFFNRQTICSPEKIISDYSIIKQLDSPVNHFFKFFISPDPFAILGTP